MPKLKQVHARVSDRLKAFIEAKAGTFYQYLLRLAQKDGYKPDQND